MPDGGTTVRIPDETAAALGELSARTGRSSEVLAAEAIAGYVAREAQIVAAIERGRADARAGRVVPHEDAMRRIQGVVDAARTRR